MEQMWKMPDQPPPIDLSSLVNPGQVEGRVVVITGANVGLGLEAARHFANLKPARLILGCRNEDRGNQALQGTVDASALEALVHAEGNARWQISSFPPDLNPLSYDYSM